MGARRTRMTEVCALKLLSLKKLPRKKHSQIIARSELEEPIRAELFSSERLEQHGETLAAAQQVTTTPQKGRPLLPRVMDNGRVLLASCRSGGAAIRD